MKLLLEEFTYGDTCIFLHELGKYKDLLMKAETERSALDVKLKHARNQVDVEIKRRQRAEADCEKLVCIVFLLAL